MESFQRISFLLHPLKERHRMQGIERILFFVRCAIQDVCRCKPPEQFRIPYENVCEKLRLGEDLEEDLLKKPVFAEIPQPGG